MAIVQTKRQSDLEKRLKLLRHQVYGGNKSSAISYQLSDKTGESDDRKLTTESYSEITYVHKDLFKILIFSSFAIGAQVILLILLQNHILNLNFF